MVYNLTIKPKAIKVLGKLNEPHYSAIKTAIYQLADEPRPHGCKKLKGRAGIASEPETTGSSINASIRCLQ